MSYTLLKNIHVSCVILSYVLFVSRGWWVLNGSIVMTQRWVRWLPHVIDSVLLISAIALAAKLGYSPMSTPWLQAKLAALLVYIALGSVAIKRGRTRRSRIAAWLLAQAVFIYIASVALTHSALPWLEANH